MSQTFVTATRTGSVGRVTLTRPAAINALDHAMIRTIDAAVRAWAHDEGVECLVLAGEGPRGFCAGGDVKAVAISAGGDGGAARALWWDEYRMNAVLAEYPKPVVSLLHGITYGGGVGLGCHVGTRVVTGDTRIAMPETVIGLVPDVGGTWLLSRAPGELGTHLALTGLPVGPGDAIACGLADLHTSPAVFARIAAADSYQQITDVLLDGATPAPAGRLVTDRAWIDRCYAGDDVAAIIAALRAEEDPAAGAAADVLVSRSPTALAITLAAIRRSRRLAGLREVLVQDYRLMTHSLARADLREGIRAQVIDKDRTPRWNPATIDDVDPAVVARAFTEVTGGDLTFD